MTARSRTDTIEFRRPFSLKSIDRIIPAGCYKIVTDDELIEGLSFSVYRRIVTMIVVPARSGMPTEMIAVDARELDAALEHDAAPL